MKEKNVLMSVQEMIEVKDVWKKYSKEAKNILEDIKNIEQTKENCWELKSLEMSYSYFIDQIRKIVRIYSALIQLKEEDDLNKEEFLLAMKALQIANNDLKVEYNKKSFKTFNEKYVESLLQLKNV